MDGWDPGPVCGCWFVSFPTPACNRPLLTPLHCLHCLIVLIHSVYHWYNGECYWQAWNQARASVTLITVIFSIVTKISCQWRTFAFLTVSKVLFIYIRLAVMITLGIYISLKNSFSVCKMYFNMLPSWCYLHGEFAWLSQAGRMLLFLDFLYFSLCPLKDWRKFVIRIECTDQQCVMLAMVHLRVSVMTQRQTVRVSY